METVLITKQQIHKILRKQNKMTTVQDRIDTYVVKLPCNDNDNSSNDDGTKEKLSYEYTIRGLKSDDEVIEWSKFCTSVFAYKSNPPSEEYFQRHYFNDPDREHPSLIRVATYKGTIVASCRLFIRKISTGTVSANSTSAANNKFIIAGGIGEVCTDIQHRKRGLSKVLVQNVINIIKEKKTIQVSLLHAGETFFPVYQKIGNYLNSTSHWSTITINQTSNLLQYVTNTHTANTSTAKYFIREAIFPQDVNNLWMLHQKFSEERFTGCIIRSEEYWTNYLSKELGGSLFVLCQKEDNNNDNNNNNGKIVAWLSIRPRGIDRYQLREFGMDEETITIVTALPMLLAHAIQKRQQQQPAASAEGINDDSTSSWKLSLPTFLLKEPIMKEQMKDTLPFVDWSTVSNDDDLGWMYKIIDNETNADIRIGDIDGSIKPHLIWPADSF